MSKMKEIDILADKCTVEIIDKIHKTCNWALAVHWYFDKASLGDFNEAHDYLVQLVASKVANKPSPTTLRKLRK